MKVVIRINQTKPDNSQNQNYTLHSILHFNLVICTCQEEKEKRTILLLIKQLIIFLIFKISQNSLNNNFSKPKVTSSNVFHTEFIMNFGNEK